MEELISKSAESRQMLEAVVSQNLPAIMTYSSKGKWHAVKVEIAYLGANKFDVNVSPREKPCPINIRSGQSVGISVKYRYGKFIFEAEVIGFEPSCESAGGGKISLKMPARIEMVHRRSYFRVSIPESKPVNVCLWHRRRGENEYSDVEGEGFEGRLIDISAGGAQIAMDSSKGCDFRKGQFIVYEFEPKDGTEPLRLNAQIRNILPTADEGYICLGLQMVGLEADEKGRELLKRLCDVVEYYYQLAANEK